MKKIQKQALKRYIERLTLGDHICCIYKNKTEQREMAVNFLRKGLINNERCLYIVDENTKKDVLSWLRKAGIAVNKRIKSGQLDILTKRDSYLKSGYFDPDKMIRLLKESEKKALSSGYTGLRVTGEMTWAFSGKSGVERLVEYEAKLNYFFPGSKSVAACQYNEARFSAKTLPDVIHSHPFVIVSGLVCTNYYYIPPDEMLIVRKGKIPKNTKQIYRRMKENLVRRALLAQREELLGKQLRLSEERYRVLCMNMPSGVAVYKAVDNGRNFIFQDFNKSAERIDNVKKKHLIGKKVTAVFPGVRKLGLFDVFKRVWRTGKPEYHSDALYEDSRHSGWRENFVYKISSGEIVAVYNDVTKRKELEHSLRESAREWQRTFDAISDLTFVLDNNQAITRVNRSFLKVFKVKAKDVIGRKCYELVHKRNTPWPDCPFKATKKTKSSCTLEVNDPNIGIPLLVTTSGVFDDKGKMIEMIHVAKDITDIKKSRANLEKAYQKLIETQSQLLQAEKMQTIGIIASGVAHEVKNPLGIIQQGIDYLENEIPRDNAAVSKGFDLVKSNISRATQIINTLLDFSRSQNIQSKETDVNSILKTSLKLVQHRAKLENIELVKELAGDLPRARLDITKMEQVILNLCLNAIDAMSKGGRLYIRSYLTKIDKTNQVIGQRRTDYFRVGDRVIKIEIEDTGEGIKKEHLEKIFDPFFSTKQAKKGSGLGLYVVRNIIDVHKGVLEVESEPGKGTKFTIILRPVP